MLRSLRSSRWTAAIAAGVLFTALLEALLLVVPFESAVRLRVLLPLNGPGMRIVGFVLTIFYNVFPRDPFLRSGVPHIHLQLSLVNFVVYSVFFYLMLSAWAWIRSARPDQEHGQS
jgi:hypothetical protein